MHGKYSFRVGSIDVLLGLLIQEIRALVISFRRTAFLIPLASLMMTWLVITPDCSFKRPDFTIVFLRIINRIYFMSTAGTVKEVLVADLTHFACDDHSLHSV